MTTLKKFQNSYFVYFLMYNFYFLSLSLFSTLISVYMLDKGYTAGQVSIVVSASFFSSMLAQPIMGMLNDTLGIKRVSLVSFGLIILGAIFFMQADNLWLLTICYSFVLMLINGVSTVMDVLATQYFLIKTGDFLIESPHVVSICQIRYESRNKNQFHRKEIKDSKR